MRNKRTTNAIATLVTSLHRPSKMRNNRKKRTNLAAAAKQSRRPRFDGSKSRENDDGSHGTGIEITQTRITEGRKGVGGKGAWRFGVCGSFVRDNRLSK